MQIIIDNNSGLCYGVKRALRIVRKTKEEKTKNVFTLGNLIHNSQIISDLEKQGVHSANSPEKIKGGTIIIRSHGVSPEVRKILNQKKVKIVDATCPIVKNIQKLVETLAKEEEEIIIVGNRDHPEIKGLIGYSKGKAIIIENESQCKNLCPKKKRAVLAQSTQDLYVFKKVATALIEYTEELRIFNTICKFTQIRQKSTSELASSVDTLFIIGDKNSSNTNKLYEISKRILPNTYLIENAEQITHEMLEGSDKIGLSSGASTPQDTINEAVLKIKTNFKHQLHRENIVQ